MVIMQALYRLSLAVVVFCMLLVAAGRIHFADARPNRRSMLASSVFGSKPGFLSFDMYLSSFDADDVARTT